MSLSKDLVFLILQFFDEENHTATAHMLERETGFFFDMKYFEEMVLSGNWDEVEKYLSGFTKVDGNKYSTKIYFEIRKQKFFEALDDHDHAKALDILVKDLKVFAPSNEELYKEMTQLLTLDDFRKHESLSMYGDTESARRRMMDELKTIIEANPSFRGKLQFPNINRSRLRRLINQSLNWQHILCANPQPDPYIKTLFVDHVCQLSTHSYAQSTENNPLPPQATQDSVPTSPGSWTSSPSTLTHSAVSDGAVGFVAPTNPDVTSDGLQDSENMSKTRSTVTLDEVASPITYPGQSHSSSFNIPDDLPKTVKRILNEESSPMSMDFHPVQQNFLLVGTNVGDVGLWEIISGKKLLSRNFKVWDIGGCSMIFKAALVKDPCVSVNCVMWSSDGSLFGVAYSKHIVQLYSYHGGNNVNQQLEIDAHVGGVNDLAFSKPDEQLYVITCGDDKIIKVWDVATGAKRYTFEGHEAPVYSVCPHKKEDIHFIFSTSVDGKIKAWLYDDKGCRVDYVAPGLWCTTMAYSADGKRLFSCGTSKNAESYVVEWNESEGALERTYQGLCKRSSGVVHFDTTKNQFLAAGDDHLIKFWDMDNVELLTTIDADGGLPACPRIRFNKEGSLLAVLANDSRIKILASDYGVQLLQTSEYCSLEASRILSKTSRKLAINAIPAVAIPGIADGGVPVVGIHRMNGETRNLEDVKSKLTEESNEKVWKVSEINDPLQFQSLRLPGHVKVNKISRLIYTNAGNAILALASNAIHLLWKWSKNDNNLSGKATTKVTPQLWKPRSGLQLMINNLIGTNLEEAVPCFALSKNDSYLMSASGETISLFNMMTFKTMMTFMPPHPAATFIAFHPQDNNVIAIGMDDSTIVIYNVRLAEVKSKLKGHAKRITGLAFSNVLNVLVSSGADAQIIVWNSGRWDKQKSTFLQSPLGGMPVAPSDTHIQFHQNQTQFLAVHETHIAIYETTKLERVEQWMSGEYSAPISHATFSCNGQLVYASFLDGTVSIFDASYLQLRCRINPTAYLPSNISSNVYPLVIAAHPQEPNQFAVGLTDGGIHVFEPLESEGKWGVLPPVDNRSASSTHAASPFVASGSD